MTESQTKNLARIIEAKFEHVAIAAPRIRDLLPIYLDLLGGKPIWASDSTTYGFRVVWIEYGNGTWHELMEPLRGSTFFDKFFSKRPAGGAHHITFTVKDINQAQAACEAQGFAIVGRSDESSEWKEFFLDLRETSGTLIQIAETTLKLDHMWTIEQILNGEHGNGIPSP